MEQKTATQVTTEVAMKAKRYLNVMTGDPSFGELQQILRLKNVEYFSDHGIKNEREGIYAVTLKNIAPQRLTTV